MVRDKPLSFEREIRFAAISQISPKTVQDNWRWGYKILLPMSLITRAVRG